MALTQTERLYYQLLRIRMVEQAISAKYVEQKMRCPVHLSIGQEAIAVGVCENLESTDYVMGSHRSHDSYLAKGGDLKKLISELYGKVTGCSKGRGGSMHLIDTKAGFLGSVPIIGSTISIGVGFVFGKKLQKEKNMMVLFFGDGATEEGVFYESVNFSILHELPVLFVCENNGLSTQTPLSLRRHKNTSLAKIMEGFGLETVSLDGQDCESIFTGAKKAIKSIREKSCPVYMECKTYRFSEHCGPKTEILEKYDPISMMSKKVTEEFCKYCEETIQKEIEEAFNFAEAAPFPKRTDLGKYVYWDASDDSTN